MIVTETTEQDTKATEADATASAPKLEMKWYVVNTYSGHENRAKLGL